MAAPPLPPPGIGPALPPEPGPVHLPDVQQGLQPTQQPAHPQPLPHRREALQVLADRMRQGLQREEQHEASREGLPQRGGQAWRQHAMSKKGTVDRSFFHVLFLHCFFRTLLFPTEEAEAYDTTEGIKGRFTEWLFHILLYPLFTGLGHILFPLAEGHITTV